MKGGGRDYWDELKMGFGGGGDGVFGVWCVGGWVVGGGWCVG